jgi:hypothetical protein
MRVAKIAAIGIAPLAIVAVLILSFFSSSRKRTAGSRAPTGAAQSWAETVSCQPPEPEPFGLRVQIPELLDYALGNRHPEAHGA